MCRWQQASGIQLLGFQYYTGKVLNHKGEEKEEQEEEQEEEE